MTGYIIVNGDRITVDYPRGVTGYDIYYILPFQSAPEIQRLGLVLGKISAVSAQENNNGCIAPAYGLDREPSFQCLRWHRTNMRFEASAACGVRLSGVEDEHVACIPADISTLHCFVSCSIIKVPELKYSRLHARTMRRVQMLLTLREIVHAAGVGAEMRDLLPVVVLAAYPRLAWR